MVTAKQPKYYEDRTIHPIFFNPTIIMPRAGPWPMTLGNGNRKQGIPHHNRNGDNDDRRVEIMFM
jgi:hypothetical protein